MNRILGKAHDPRAGLCYVESIGGDHFRLTPLRSPNNRLIKHRTQIQWRKK